MRPIDRLRRSKTKYQYYWLSFHLSNSPKPRSSTRSTKSALPLVVVDSRGKEKVLKTPPSKPKKMRLVRASEREYKKTKVAFV